MQSDNNLIVYYSNRIPIWSSNTWTGSIGDPYFLKMRNDGNLVMYNNNAATLVWQTNTITSNSIVFSKFFS